MPSAQTVAQLAVVVSADTSAAEKGLTDLGTKVGNAGSALQTAFTGAAVAGIAAVGAGLAASVVAATDFEKTMSGVKAVSGATADEMAALQQTALDLGAKTAFSASEAGKGIEELVKGGLTVQEAMTAAEATLNLAAAGGIAVADAATIAANALAQFNLPAEEMAHVSDLIAGAANASALDVSQFKFSLQAAGAVAATVGFSFDDLAQGIAVMGKAGITGSDAGTSLKTMMMSLQPSTKKTSELFRELGLITADGANQFFTAEGSVKSMAEVAQVLQDSLAGMTDAQRIATLETLFGSDAVRAGAVLAKEGAAGFNDMAAAMGKVTAETVGAEKLNNLAGSVEQLKGSLETMGIMIGLELLPILKDFVDALTQAANDAMPAMQAAAKEVAATLREWAPTLKAVASFLWENRDAVLAVIAAFATFAILTTVVGWVVAIAGAVSAVTAAISASGGILAALGALVAILGGPVTLIIAAVALAVGALAYAWANNWGDIQGKTEAVVEFLSGVPDMVAGFFEAIGQSAEGLQMAVEQAWDAITTATETVWNGIKQFLEDWWRTILIVLGGPIGALAVLIIDNWETIKSATETIFAAIANALTAVWGLIYDEIIAPKLAAIKLAVETAWEAIRSAIEDKITAAQTLLATAWDAIATKTTETLNAFLAFVRDTIFEPLRAAVAERIAAAQTAVEAAWQAISDKAHAILDPVLAYIRDTIFTPIQTAVETAMTAVTTAFETSVNAVKTAVDTTMGAVKTAWETVWGAITRAAESPKKALDEVKAAVQALKDVMPDWLIPHSPTPFEIGIRGIADAVERMSKTWRSMSDAIRGANGEIAGYIANAAQARGIDPGVALRIAQHEGGLEEYNKVGKFNTGWSWWPFQLHYGGKGYEEYGTTAGMGNDFTARTGWRPGDPKAWKDSVDFALDHARKHGWGAWYGRGPAGVGAWEGIPGHAAGGWAGLHGPELAWLGERGPEYVIPNAALNRPGGALSAQTLKIDVAIGGRLAEEIYVTGHDLAVRRGRVPAGTP